MFPKTVDEKIRCAVLLAILLFVTLLAYGEERRVSITKWVDGDTFKCWDGSNEITVRLIGIDTPETWNNEKALRDSSEWGTVSIMEIVRCGREAHYFSESIAPPGVEVVIYTTVNDGYGRTLAYVELESGLSINEWLLREGMAISRYRHADSRRYGIIEYEASKGKKGFHPILWKSRNRR